MSKLYFCNGYACDENNKQYCYRKGGECFHTPNLEHSISKITNDFPPTKFVPFGASGIVVEEFDEPSIFAEMRNDKELKLIESE